MTSKAPNSCIVCKKLSPGITFPSIHYPKAPLQSKNARLMYVSPVQCPYKTVQSSNGSVWTPILKSHKTFPANFFPPEPECLRLFRPTDGCYCLEKGHFTPSAEFFCKNLFYSWLIHGKVELVIRFPARTARYSGENIHWTLIHHTHAAMERSFVHSLLYCFWCLKDGIHFLYLV